MSPVSEVDRLALFVREDALDTIRERQAHMLAVLFALVGMGVAYNTGRAAGRLSAGETIELAPQLLGPLALLVPLIALGFVAPGLVEKRTTGALTVLLGLPFSRLTVVVGTWLGGCLVVGSATLFAVVVAVPIALAMGASVDPGRLGLSALALVLLVVTYVAIATAISAVSRTSTRATVAAFGAYVLFTFDLWQWLAMQVAYVRYGFSYPETVPIWVEFVGALNPTTAFANWLGGISGTLAEAALASPTTDPAFFERPAFAAGVLLAWIVVTVGFGYWRFRATDL